MRTTDDTMPYWHFSTDPQGAWIDDAGIRYSAHSAAYWVTPGGLNAGCPQAATEQEAGEAMGYSYEPLPDPEDETV